MFGVQVLAVVVVVVVVWAVFVEVEVVVIVVAVVEVEAVERRRVPSQVVGEVVESVLLVVLPCQASRL